MKKTFSLLCSLIILSSAGLYSQDVKNSFGPAPFVNKTAAQNEVIDAQVGTRYFTQISSSPTFQFARGFLESCNLTNIGTPFPITFPGGLFYRNGVVYTWNQSAPFQLWSIDTVTGAPTLKFNMAGVPQANLTGMTWDGTNVYGVSTSISVSQIFTVNMITGACTPIGTPSATCAGPVFLAGRLGTAGSLFSADVVLDNFYKWNKTTGVATLVGPLGANFNSVGDAQYDNNDGKLYWVSGAELWRLDSNGSGVMLCSFGGSVTGIALIYVPPFPFPYSEFCRTGIAITLLDNSLVRESVLVPACGGCEVRDVNYKITNMTHTWDSDVRMYAQHLGLGSLIVNWVGGSGDNFINTVLNDSASVPIASGVAPFTGSFIPSNPLTGFIGQTTDGYWKLVLTDSAAGDTGLLTGWCVQLMYYTIEGGIQTIEIPNYYSLGQNYPNPFNPVTVIKFTLPESQNVKLVVFDILGREVKTLINEVRSSGIYEVNFDASELSSGVYFYRIVTDNFTDTKKMLMIK